MPSSRFVVIYFPIYTNCHIRIQIHIVMRDKITLADAKFAAHESMHLINCQWVLPDQSLPLFRSACESHWRSLITMIFNKINNRYTKTGATTDRSNNVLKYF